MLYEGLNQYRSCRAVHLIMDCKKLSREEASHSFTVSVIKAGFRISCFKLWQKKGEEVNKSKIVGESEPLLHLVCTLSQLLAVKVT